MKRALIHGERVCQIEPVGSEFPVAPPLVWIDCADTTTTNHRYVNGAFIAPAPITPVTDGVTFMKTIHLNLTGVSAPAKLTRAMTLRQASRHVMDFIHNTSHMPLSAGRLAAAKVIWSWVKSDPLIGLTGTDVVNRLTATEVAAIEADADVKGVPLT